MGIFDTLLNAQQQADFDRLNNLNISMGGRDWNKDKVDYDMNGAYLAGLLNNYDGQSHLTDQFKKPNHITFSQESQYSTPETPGGIWDRVAVSVQGQILPEDKDSYTPSDYVLWQHSPAEMREYFRKFEPNAILNIIPNSDWK